MKLNELLKNGFGKCENYSEEELARYGNVNMNCAERILRGANEAYGLGLSDEALKVSAPFGGGMGIGSVCGAITGAIMVLSVKYCDRTEKNIPLKDDITVTRIASNKDIFNVKKPEDDIEGDWEDIKAVLDIALDGFIERRITEGENLLKNIREKIENIKGYVAKISENSERDTREYANKLKERIVKFLDEQALRIDEQRILTEVAIFADKIAIDEELVRLDSHFGAFEEIASSNEPAGRKLDFLVQEMNRETNTMGSKASNSDTAHLVVNIKNELEKIREQIQNIE